MQPQVGIAAYFLVRHRNYRAKNLNFRLVTVNAGCQTTSGGSDLTEYTWLSLVILNIKFKYFKIDPQCIARIIAFSP